MKEKMDDKEFDKAIKNRLEQYEDPDFDPVALADLRLRMAAGSSPTWFARYRTEVIVIASLVAFTMINMLLWTSHSGQEDSVTLRLLDSLKVRHDQIVNLQKEIANLKIEELSGKTELSTPVGKDTVSSHPLLHPNDSSPLSSLHDRQLRENGASTPENNSINTKIQEPYAILPRLENIFPSWCSSENPTHFQHYSLNGFAKGQPQKTKKIHHKKALRPFPGQDWGLRLGPTAHLTGLTHSKGAWGGGLSAGIIAEWLFNPYIILESGLDYQRLGFTYEEQAADYVHRTPDGDEENHQHDDYFYSSQRIKLPINFKLNIPLYRQASLVIGAGYALPLFQSEKIRIREESSRLGNNYRAHDQISDMYTNGPNIYPGTMNALLGGSWSLKNDTQFECSFYYEYDLRSTHYYQGHLSTFGLRTLWGFRLR